MLCHNPGPFSLDLGRPDSRSLLDFYSFDVFKVHVSLSAPF